jgi:hypothetical protein
MSRVTSGFTDLTSNEIKANVISTIMYLQYEKLHYPVHGKTKSDQ